ncbi:ribokinase [Paenibacillus septentrionalis]|uniref:Ribokinase n=1 Tax=Paenibacillus septentrionalis TaxID=429342 RepID=A0ABW1V245_9BACL
MAKQPHIVVVGSLNMDLVVNVNDFPQVGETKLGESISYLSGGKGANQAVGCARLGARVSMVGAVGSDAFGQQIISQLEQEGIDVSGVKQIDDVATGVASITHTPVDNSIIIVAGANGRVTPHDVYEQRQKIAAADVLLVQLEIPVDAVQEALRIAKEAGVLTILNPAPAQKLPIELLQLADYMTPNEIEFQQLSGKSLDTPQYREVAADYCDKLGSSLLITRGPEGAILYDQGAWAEAAAPKVEVKDTTGAGDCLNAAFATMLAYGKHSDEALRLAVHAASISVTRYGAQDGMPTLKELSTG